MKRACENCIKFERSTKFCRKAPPIPTTVTRDGKVSIIAKWPVVPFPDRDWCGDFEAIASIQEQLLTEQK